MQEREGHIVFTGQLERLVNVIQELSLARSLEGVMAIVRRAARELTHADGATFVLRENDKCYYADEDAIAPLWKGQRFPLSRCISGWVMQHKASCIIEDIYSDDRVPAEAYRPTFVKSLLMVPIRTLEPMGAIGNYWAKPHKATDNEVRLLQALADTTAVAMENVQVYAELERRVEDRTRELARVNRLLVVENAERKRAEEEVRRQAITDPLTGLLNRRGFFEKTKQRIEGRGVEGGEWTVVFLDVDGLKAVNDKLGHDTGDTLIKAAAQVIGDAFTGEIHARLGGDEFAMLIEEPVDQERIAGALKTRVRDYMEVFRPPFVLSLSIGTARFIPDRFLSLDEVLNRADRAMYRDKQRKRESQARDELNGRLVAQLPVFL